MKKILFSLLALVVCTTCVLAQGCPSPSSAEASVTFKRKVFGLMEGNFSVASNKKVQFAGGNLQAVFSEAGTSECTWRFASLQYEYIGNNTANTAVGNNQVTTPGTVDLFGWVGVSGTGAAYGIINSNTSSVYGNTDREALKADWGNTMGEGWRTLKSDEWQYLLQSRTGDKASTVNGYTSARFVKATVNGVQGIIIFPDGGTFAASEFDDFSNSYLNNGSQSCSSTTCSAVKWEALERKGCIFLPAAGYRSNGGTTVTGVQEYIVYWCSDLSSSYYPYQFYATTSSTFYPKGSYWGRAAGMAIRLVQDVVE